MLYEEREEYGRLDEELSQESKALDREIREDMRTQRKLAQLAFIQSFLDMWDAMDRADDALITYRRACIKGTEREFSKNLITHGEKKFEVIPFNKVCYFESGEAWKLKNTTSNNLKEKMAAYKKALKDLDNLASERMSGIDRWWETALGALDANLRAVHNTWKFDMVRIEIDNQERRIARHRHRR